MPPFSIGRGVGLEGTEGTEMLLTRPGCGRGVVGLLGMRLSREFSLALQGMR